MGFQFENLVLNNIQSVCESIGISMSAIKNAGPYFQKKTQKRSGCQIDLLIETRYTLYVCEIKFRKKIEKSVISGVSPFEETNLEIEAVSSKRLYLTNSYLWFDYSKLYVLNLAEFLFGLLLS